MPHSPLTPAPTDGPVDAPTPVVHLTRRARIEAERAAAARGNAKVDAVQRVTGEAETTRTSRPSFDDLVAPAATAEPATPPAPASPVDLAPVSPALPASTVGPATPPAPASPVVAPPTSPVGAAPARPQRPASAPRASASVATLHVDRATRHLGRRTPTTARPGATAGHGSAFRRNASRVTAVGALLFAAGLVVSTSLPAQALFTPESGSTGRTVAGGATQSLDVGDAGAAETTRDQYTVSSATQYKNVDASSFTNDPNGTIQWPFLTGVPITSGFGGRQVEGCSFCSTNHMGVDFAPGEGTPIRVIAAGTVIKVQANDGGFGNDVWVEHDVDGKQFVSVYGHMEDNSFKVVKGQQVEVGDELGLVGSTGNSTGPHLHLEVHVDGVPVDPLAWLKANAN